ncbi:MAG: hypothetical protein U9N31_09155 [Candidatus Marinimicrobia bacterium]|nr:hypothetical protein [Candidatus Neomarinimicrobiota bacterium]
MKKKNSCFAIVILLFMATGYLYPQDEAKKQKHKVLQIEGEVVDLACYTSREARGEGHVSCAMRCLNRGNPAGLVDQDGNVFVIIAPSPGYAPYAAQTIRLSGNVEGGRIGPKKMEAKTGENWVEVKLRGGSPKPD